MHKVQVWLVEDDQEDELFLLEGFGEMSADISLECFPPAEPVLKRLATGTGPKPSLILIDGNLPRINGFELIQSIRRLEEDFSCV